MNIDMQAVLQLLSMSASPLLQYLFPALLCVGSYCSSCSHSCYDVQKIIMASFSLSGAGLNCTFIAERNVL